MQASKIGMPAWLLKIVSLLRPVSNTSRSDWNRTAESDEREPFQDGWQQWHSALSESMRVRHEWQSFRAQRSAARLAAMIGPAPCAGAESTDSISSAAPLAEVLPDNATLQNRSAATESIIPDRGSPLERKAEGPIQRLSFAIQILTDRLSRARAAGMGLKEVASMESVVEGPAA